MFIFFLKYCMLKGARMIKQFVNFMQLNIQYKFFTQINSSQFSTKKNSNTDNNNDNQQPLAAMSFGEIF